MRKKKVEITVVTLDKTGILGVLMVAIGGLGLIYKKSEIKPHGNNTGLLEVKLFTLGKLRCSDNELIRVIDEIPAVDHVQGISFQGEIQSNDVKLQSLDKITPQITKKAEEKLKELIGPAAILLVRKAKSNAENVGHFFSLLENEIESPEDKNLFLSAV